MTFDRLAAEQQAELDARRRRALTPAAKRLAEELWPDRSWPGVRGLPVLVVRPAPGADAD
ncbi:hypothetical protein [Nocardia thailandica]|uniref:5-formyltetrahydrofolate cyclo-ligase n=1 Tax=Nocardia thailandica TaxID=257275 RepID=A0ABW6PH56_9NOCA|nr:hypothetical protein [Nocardia thailandica]